MQQVLVTGGAGYVGAVLVPKLLQAGYRVKVVDLYIYGEDVLSAVKDHPGLEQIKGDIRDRPLLEKIIPGCAAVIHLACISNDPSFELDPYLGKSINYDAFVDLVDVAKNSGVKRFIYASSSSVYGIKETENVSEELPLQPLTDYSKYKAMCEDVLLANREPGFVTLILRPATVYSGRMFDFSALRILVLGDVMLDRFLYGAVERISPEAPVPVVRLGRTLAMPGGAYARMPDQAT